jgi:mono/diheme cytochrome c family protein
MKFKVLTAIGLLVLILMVSCQDEARIEFDRYYSAGNLLYQQRCQNCHGEHGEGLQALIPPLTDSVYLKTNKAILPCSVNNGLKGKITILNRQFDGQMPANNLTPIELAKVLTYITNSFGNKQGLISVDVIGADLAKCK